METHLKICSGLKACQLSDRIYKPEINLLKAGNFATFEMHAHVRHILNH